MSSPHSTRSGGTDNATAARSAPKRTQDVPRAERAASRQKSSQIMDRFLLVGFALVSHRAAALATLPAHLRGGEVGRAWSDPAESAPLPPQFLPVPLDHTDPSGATWLLKFYVDDTAWRDGGAVLLTMPSEGPQGAGCNGGALAQALHAASICPEHRYFGSSVPKNDSSTAALRQFMSVEANLADMAALLVHARSTLHPTATATVVTGGSYAGASAAWMRRRWSSLVDAAIAYSPPVTARLGFPEYPRRPLWRRSSAKRDSWLGHVAGTTPPTWWRSPRPTRAAPTPRRASPTRSRDSSPATVTS